MILVQNKVKKKTQWYPDLQYFFNTELATGLMLASFRPAYVLCKKKLGSLDSPVRMNTTVHYARPLNPCNGLDYTPPHFTYLYTPSNLAFLEVKQT